MCIRDRGYFVLASTWYDFLRDNKNVLEDFMWHADEAETSMALALYGDLVHMDLAIDGGGTPLVDPKWKMAPGEASHRWQFYGAEGTFALLEKDDLDYGVIGNQMCIRDRCRRIAIHSLKSF